ncbi:MAG TPA: hypothetical protein VLF93_05465, partial [Candidatus Saccharimonadales bacterium]|nr:hypothetical protein [Candidatus Saccharimonadales bacterium]
KFPLSKIFQKLDKDTKNPGKKLFEKNISGMYLAKIFNLWAEELNIITSPVFTGQELSAIAHAYHNESAKRLARVVLDQSASYIGAAIVALYEFKDKPRNFTIIAEGGLMWDGWHYHESLMNQIEALGISSKEITIKNIKDSSIHGAIGLVLS